eukprot:14410387-Ditylum_brightwellii.AAC.1
MPAVSQTETEHAEFNQSGDSKGYTVSDYIVYQDNESTIRITDGDLTTDYCPTGMMIGDTPMHCK